MPAASFSEHGLISRITSGATFLYLLALRILKKVATQMSFFLSRLEKFASSRIQQRSFKEFNPQSHVESVIASTKYNMREALGEKYYAQQYWENFKDFLPSEESSPTIVDLGCGQGRFALDFARMYPNGRIIGVDLSPSAIEDAKIQASASKLTNVEFVCSTIEESVDYFEASSIDILVFTEVAFYNPNWRESFQSLCAKVSPGGLIVASFRSTYFNLLLVIAEQRLVDAERVVTSRQGQLWAQNPVHFSWINSSELVQEFENQHVEVQRVTGIGLCSGITGDPHDRVSKPWELSQEDQDRLMQVELKMGPVVPDAGRYILIVARKKTHEESH
jgi:2-polyprenyl-3-methyl-5-hydroxy-6-metoxy-1,4-benzoquinol methylase